MKLYVELGNLVPAVTNTGHALPMYFKVKYHVFLIALDDLESGTSVCYELVVLRIITYQINTILHSSSAVMETTRLHRFIIRINDQTHVVGS